MLSHLVITQIRCLSTFWPVSRISFFYIFSRTLMGQSYCTIFSSPYFKMATYGCDHQVSNRLVSPARREMSLLTIHRQSKREDLFLPLVFIVSLNSLFLLRNLCILFSFFSFVQYTFYYCFFPFFPLVSFFLPHFSV